MFILVAKANTNRTEAALVHQNSSNVTAKYGIKVNNNQQPFTIYRCWAY